jgi:hypothetical protein
MTMASDALLCTVPVSAQGTATGVNAATPWFQEIQAIGAVATTIGVLIALYVAIVREPRKAAEERKRHKAQFDALRRVHGKRVAAQARKVVPSCARTPIFGDTWWTVRIDNTSKAATTILAVEVAAMDANGIEVPDGCRQANNTMPVDQALERSVLAALSTFAGGSQEQGSELSPALKHVLRDAFIGHFATGWQRILPPNQASVMAYTTTKPDYTLRVTIEYEDESGYLWRRTDTSQPKRVGWESLLAGGADWIDSPAGGLGRRTLGRTGDVGPRRSRRLWSR